MTNTAHTHVRDTDDFVSELTELGVCCPGLGREHSPDHSFQPFHWSGAALRRVLEETPVHQPTLTKVRGSERRLIRLATPGVPGTTVTNTMSLSLQYLLPGEIAPAHRHTPVAFRFFLEGEAHTTVEGERFNMQPGDLVITPYLEWHDHGNDSDEPAMWIDGLDLPLVKYLNTDVMEYGEDDEQSTKKTGASERRWSHVGLRPAWEVERDRIRLDRRSIVHYKWSTTYAALIGLSEAGEADAFDDVFLEYTNAATARSAFKTIGCYIQMIRPGIRTRSHRHTGSGVYFVFKGSGYSVVNGIQIDWTEGDFLLIPPMAPHAFGNSGNEPAILMSVQDTPTYRALGLYREEACDEA